MCVPFPEFRIVQVRTRRKGDRPSLGQHEEFHRNLCCETARNWTQRYFSNQRKLVVSRNNRLIDSKHQGSPENHYRDAQHVTPPSTSGRYDMKTKKESELDPFFRNSFSRVVVVCHAECSVQGTLDPPISFSAISKLIITPWWRFHSSMNATCIGVF